MRVRRYPLRMHCGNDVNVQLSLSRLPAGDRRGSRLRRGRAGGCIPSDERRAQLSFHGQRRHRPSQARFLRLTGGENRQGTSEIVGINAGSLDDPSWFQPQYDIFTSDAQSWDQMDSAIPKYEKYPPG